MMVLLLLACFSAAPPVPEVPHEAEAPHAHGAPHGGLVQIAGDLHVEAKITPSGIMMWMSDPEERPVPPEGLTATAVVQAGGRVQTATFAPMGDHLHAMVDMEKGAPARVVITLVRERQARSLEFEVEAVGLAFHDHTPAHGGSVGMFGDVHVELARPAGRTEVYVSDAYRRVVSEGVAGNAVVGGREVALSWDAAQGLLWAEVEASGVVVVNLTVGEAKFEMEFPAEGGHPVARAR